MNHELMEIMVFLILIFTILIGVFLLVYLSDKKAKELEQRGLK